LPHLFDHQNVSKLHDPERKNFQDPSRLFPLIHPFEKGASAEIGAGSGYVFFPMADHLSSRGMCYAIELQPEMIEHFNRELADRGGPKNIKTLLSGKDAISLEDGSLELVWMVNVFHELTHPREIFSEIFRILSPLGQCLVVDWKKEETPKGPPVSERASDLDLYEVLIEAGFSRIRSFDTYHYHYVVEALKG
jgi:ubiquinone/menaquinone biosynthesis C-methylase UbiE